MERYHGCPKCGRRLKSSGIVYADDGAGSRVKLPVYQCDECLVQAEMFGAKFEGALTFAVRADGTLFDPAAPDGELRF